jgi:cytochrome b561
VPALSGTDATLKAVAGAVHEYTAVVLAVLASIHILAALKHHFVDRDHVLRGMLPFASAHPSPQQAPEQTP